MKIFRVNTKSNFTKLNTNLAIGNFDGVHLGHKAIIEKLVQESKKINVESAILSFSPHPRQYFRNDFENFNIVDENTKIQLFEELNVDNYIIFKFDKNLASLTADQFISQILFDKLKINNLIVGYDFKFGKDRKGDITLLKKLSSKYSYNISIIDQVTDPISSKTYSSSLIRENIKEGKFEKVTSFLGRNWSIIGKVIYGDKRARTMNFPTANIALREQIKPKKGVYAVKVKYINNNYNGIANFGERPTVDGKKLLLEVHIFNFNQNIYGKELTVEFLTFIRDEKKFDNFDLLSKQIRKDIQIAKTYHSKN